MADEIFDHAWHELRRIVLRSVGRKTLELFFLENGLEKLLKQIRQDVRDEIESEQLAAGLDYSQFRYALVNLSATSNDPGGAYDVMAISDTDTPDMNCIISLTGEGDHFPMLDLDFPATVVPSSTKGHVHLIINGKRLDHLAYKKLLDAFKAAGLLEDGNISRFEQNGFSVLRKPTTRKGIQPNMHFVPAPWTASQCMQLRRWQMHRRPVAYHCWEHQPGELLYPTKTGWRCPKGCAPVAIDDELDDSLIREANWSQAPRFMFDSRVAPPDPNQRFGAATLSLIDLSRTLRQESAA